MRLGAHMSVAGGKHLALDRGKAIGCETIQIFVRNVRSWTSKPLLKDDIDKFIKKKLRYYKRIFGKLSDRIWRTH